MRLINSDGAGQLYQVQLYLSVQEARDLVAGLGKLLEDPESNGHLHVISKDGGGELSCSVVTPAKLKAGGYSKAERGVLETWKPE